MPENAGFGLQKSSSGKQTQTQPREIGPGFSTEGIQMSQTPRKCQFCGCAEINYNGYPDINSKRHVRFGCGSVWIDGDSIEKTGWVQDRLWCGGKVGELYSRITQAAEVLIEAQRYRLSSGIWVDARDVDKAVERLSGNVD